MPPLSPASPLPAPAPAAPGEPYRSLPIDLPPGGNLQPAPASMEATRPAGPCIIFNNLPISGGNARVRGPGHPIELHVDTRDKGPSAYSSITPLLQLPSPRTPDRDWFFPWRDAYPSPAQLSIRWDVEVRSIETRTADSHAYGHPTLEFIDTRSGRHLYFTVLAYGTVEGGDHLAPDVASQIVIVGTTPRAGSPYGRSSGTGWARLPRNYATGSGPGARSQVDFRIDLAEFGRVLEAARSVDGRLSAHPADYLLDNYHFNNEVFGDGRIDLDLQVELRVLRR